MIWARDKFPADAGLSYKTHSHELWLFKKSITVFSRAGRSFGLIFRLVDCPSIFFHKHLPYSQSSLWLCKNKIVQQRCASVVCYTNSSSSLMCTYGHMRSVHNIYILFQKLARHAVQFLPVFHKNHKVECFIVTKEGFIVSK